MLTPTESFLYPSQVEPREFGTTAALGNLGLGSGAFVDEPPFLHPDRYMGAFRRYGGAGARRHLIQSV